MAIVAFIKLGTLAALLTALEFVLGVISSLSARAFLHGIWLSRLHRGATEQISSSVRDRRAIRKSALATLLGIWLVIGVALVESNLQEGVQVKSESFNSSRCVSMSAKIKPKRVLNHTPPIRATLERWVLKAASQLRCESTGIDTVGVGGTTDSFGARHDMFAPTCAEKKLEPKKIVSKPGVSEFEGDGLFTEMGDGEGFTLFPHDGMDLGFEKERNEEGGVCAKVGLSSYMHALPGQFETEFAHTMNMTATVHERICKLHGKRDHLVVPDATTDPCVIDDEFELLDIQCLRGRVRDNYVNVVELNEMSALFVGANSTAPSFVCLNATIRYEYVLISAVITVRGDDQSGVLFPVIVPTTVSPLTGHCERTVAPLGQAALMYTMNAEWTKDELTRVPRVTLYHAYMMAVSSSQFPFASLRDKESAMENGQCLVRAVVPVTEIPTDWRLAILFSGLLVVVVLTVIALIFRLWFSGEAWSVGSAHWSLNKLLGDGLCRKEALIEVIEVSPFDSPATPVMTGSRAGAILHKVTAPLREPASALSKQGSNPLSGRVFEYRLRTVQSDDSDDSFRDARRPHGDEMEW